MGYSPLYYAIKCGHVDAVQLLIEHGANINIRYNKDKYIPLITALTYGHLDCTRCLLENGADPNIGTLPLIYALDGGHNRYELVKLLLKYGACINISNAFYHASKNHDVDMMILLLDHGAAYNYILDDGAMYERIVVCGIIEQRWTPADLRKRYSKAVLLALMTDVQHSITTGAYQSASTDIIRLLERAYNL